MLSHDNITWAARSLAKSVGAEPGQDRVVSMLPFATGAAQMFELWLPMAAIATVYFGQAQPLHKVGLECRGAVSFSAGQESLAMV